LAGVSRQVVIELALAEGFEVRETDLTAIDAAESDEAFITSTSFCICPVRTYDGVTLGASQTPGPVTQRLTHAFAREAKHDFVAQYLNSLESDS
jgi:branched-chain amino acid aminotransferase